MDNEKDRFGDKLHDLERAREDQWAWEQDRKLIEKLKQKHGAALLCPICQEKLTEMTQAGVTVMVCPSGHGGWLDTAALGTLPR